MVMSSLPCLTFLPPHRGNEGEGNFRSGRVWYYVMLQLLMLLSIIIGSVKRGVNFYCEEPLLMRRKDGIAFHE